MFLRLKPGTTLTIIGFSALSRVTSVLAFFLPLKVILLAGSPGLPRNLGSFIEPGQKMDWIIWLSVASVVSYVLTLFFDAFSGRLAESGSAGVLEGANKLALVGKQRRRARSTYSKAVQAVAAFAFGAVGLIALAIINMTLFAAFIVLFFLEFLFTSLVLANWNAAYPGRLQSFIRDKLDDYLNVLSSINFLTGFFLILAPFLAGQESNILLAVLAVVVVRRAMPALESAIDIVAGLYMDRHVIDPLVFRKRRLQVQESADHSIAREVFNNPSRRLLAEKHLAKVRPGLRDFEVSWQDSAIKEVYTFVISCRPGAESGREYFQQQVYTPEQAHLAGNEDFLFSTVDRGEINAPGLLARFKEGAFECRILEYGSGEALSEERYQLVLPRLLADIWGFRPPKKLVAAFNTARETLPGRLTADMLGRLTVATDSAAESAVLSTLQARLPELRARLERLPLHILNPDMSRSTVAEIRPGELRIMTWGHWTLEPVGAGIPEELPRAALPDLVKQFNSGGAGTEPGLALRDIEFADACWALEQEIMQNKYKAALKTAAVILTMHTDSAY